MPRLRASAIWASVTSAGPTCESDDREGTLHSVDLEALAVLPREHRYRVDWELLDEVALRIGVLRSEVNVVLPGKNFDRGVDAMAF